MKHFISNISSISTKLARSLQKGRGEGGEGGGSYFADKCITGACFLDNEGSAYRSLES